MKDNILKKILITNSATFATNFPVSDNQNIYAFLMPYKKSIKNLYY